MDGPAAVALAAAPAASNGRQLVWRLGIEGAWDNSPAGTLVVEGKTSDVFQLSDGRRVKGQDLLSRSNGSGGSISACPGAGRPTHGLSSYQPKTMRSQMVPQRIWSRKGGSLRLNKGNSQAWMK
jgi:hypothetical protein